MSLRGLRVSGRIYGDGRDLELFPPICSGQSAATDKRVSWSTIYGTNGSGKSSLSTAVWNYKTDATPEEEHDDSFLKASLLPDGVVAKENVFVFNEDFTEQRVHFSTDDKNLRAITMLGNAGGATQAIGNTTKKLKQLDGVIEAQRGKEKELLDDIKTKEDALCKAFRGDRNWAGIVKTIKGYSVGAPVSIVAIKSQFEQNKEYLIEDSKINDERKKFDDEQTKFDDEKELGHLDPLPVIELIRYKTLLSSVITALKEIPETPSIDGNDLVKRIQGNPQGINIEETKDFLSHSPESCTLCLQPISEDWISRVTEAINIINQESTVKQARENISTLWARTDELEQAANTYLQNEIETINETNLRGTVGKILKDCKCIKNALSRKQHNIYSPISIEYPADQDESNNTFSDIFLADLNDVRKSALAVNRQIEELNHRVANHQKEMENLIQRITILELSRNKSGILELLSLEKNLAVVRASLNPQNASSLVLQKKALNADLNRAKSALAQVNIAMKRINNALALLFLDPNYLSLKPADNNSYEILVRGKPVPLSQLSTGEKNAIALAYFLSMPYEGKHSDSQFDHNLLFILDDPISSLDRTNEIGMFSLLAEAFKEIKEHLSAGTTMQIAVLTHSLPVYYALDRVGKLLFNSTKVDGKPCHNYLTLSLKSGELKRPREGIDYNYRSSIEDIYNFARCDSPDPNDINTHQIPNELRRVLEEYATFNFGIGATGLTKQKLIRQKLEERVQDGKINELAARMIEQTLVSLWTNAGSHGAERARSGSFDHTIYDFAVAETQKTARLMLLLLDQIHFTGLPGIINGSGNDNEKKRNQVTSDLNAWDASFGKAQPQNPMLETNRSGDPRK